MPWFARRGSGPPPTVIAYRAWTDPDLDALCDLLESPADRTGRINAALGLLAAVQGDPERRVLVNRAAADRIVDCVDELGAAAVRISDARRAADAWGLLAQTLIHPGWQVRGAGWSGTGHEQTARTYHEMMLVADDAGRRALEIEPGHPAAAVAHLHAGRGLDLSAEQWWTRFEVARLARPTLYAGHTGFLRAVHSWFGDHELMFDVARSAAAGAPSGDPVGAVLPLAHLEYSIHRPGDASARRHRARVEKVRAADRAAVQEVSDRWFAGGPPALAHPYAVAAHQVFGWFLLEVGDLARAHAHLSLVGNRIAGVPWDYRPAPEKAFGEALARAGVTAGTALPARPSRRRSGVAG